MGDGILAYFGYPRAHEDDAEHSVRRACLETPPPARVCEPSVPLGFRDRDILDPIGRFLLLAPSRCGGPSFSKTAELSNSPACDNRRAFCRALDPVLVRRV
jgi:hypothetical protein